MSTFSIGRYFGFNEDVNKLFGDRLTRYLPQPASVLWEISSGLLSP